MKKKKRGIRYVHNSLVSKQKGDVKMSYCIRFPYWTLSVAVARDGLVAGRWMMNVFKRGYHVISHLNI